MYFFVIFTYPNGGKVNQIIGGKMYPFNYTNIVTNDANNKTNDIITFIMVNKSNVFFS
jgi:hypothetical protein